MGFGPVGEVGVFVVEAVAVGCCGALGWRVGAVHGSICASGLCAACCGGRRAVGEASHDL